MSKSILKLIDEQIKRWEMDKTQEKPIQETINVITISRQAGSQGFELAQKLCREVGFDLFNHQILEAMIEASKNSRVLLETLDERGMNVVEDVVSNFINEHHLWPDEYSKLLFQVLNTISRHGKAVILGRGANCVLHEQDVLRVRVVAPLKMRRKNIQHTQDLNAEDAQKYLNTTDANREAFVKRYFNCDANDPSNFDLILNTGTLSVDKAVQVIKCSIS